ncbi:hypothetical protein ACFLS1_05910 [Verrucomicrobiota bacterium]
MNRFGVISCLFLLAAAIITAPGCEDIEASPATTQVKITPDSATLGVGESQRFTASGGYEYTWSLQQESWGRLSARSGSETTYTSTYAPGSSTNTQILTVTSTIPTGTSSNDPPAQWTANAYINQ